MGSLWNGHFGRKLYVGQAIRATLIHARSERHASECMSSDKYVHP